jgi:hypothetical protein
VGVTAITIRGTEEEAATIEQDLMDGFALRRLREAGRQASPYGDTTPGIKLWWGDGRTFIDQRGNSQPFDFVTVETVGASPFDVVRSGATIAEAADKCREALT